MGAGMSRFVLLSAALHLGAVAALGYSPARPLLLPATLSVTLNQASDVAATPLRHRAAPVRSARDPGNASEPPLRPEPAQDATRSAASASQAPQAPQETALNDQAYPLAAFPRAEDAQTEAQPLPRPPTQPPDTTVLASQLESQLRDALAPYFAYPMMARRNGWQGQVQVGLRLEADGRLSRVHIAHSSGYRLLDNAALTTLNRIDTLPQAAGWLNGRHFDMVLPIEYRLIGG